MFIDIHNHLIYGVDDGPKTFATTQKMLAAACRDKVEQIITTPHITPGIREFPMKTYREHLKQAQEWCEENELPIALHSGSEILYTQATARMLDDGRVPTLCDTPYVLVEFLPTDSYHRLTHAADELCGAGYQPIFAHVERYECLKHADQIRELREQYRVQIQVNAGTMLEKMGFFRRRRLMKLFREDLVDYLSTDSHNLNTRRTCMRACRKAMLERFDRAQLNRLMHDNALEIIEY